MTTWNTWMEPILGLTENALLMAAVYLTITQFTRSRASSYIERFNSSDAIESRVAVDRWLKDHSSAKARLMALEEDPALRTHLRRFANLFQELGAAHQFGVAHRKSVRVLFDALVVMYWEALLFWVQDYRAQADATLYARFEYLYEEMKSREQKVRSKTEYVIAYGSLMDTQSLAAGLGRAVSPGELIPITLNGWARGWWIGDSVRAGAANAQTVAAFLDVARKEEASVVAAMIRVTSRELRRLGVREQNYEVHDVTRDVLLTGDRPVEARAVVWCFVGKEEHRVEPATEGIVILEAYLEKVVSAALLMDPDIEVGLRASAAQSGFDLLSGSYEFVSPDQAALV